MHNTSKQKKNAAAQWKGMVRRRRRRSGRAKRKAGLAVQTREERREKKQASKPSIKKGLWLIREVSSMQKSIQRSLTMSESREHAEQHQQRPRPPGGVHASLSFLLLLVFYLLPPLIRIFRGWRRIVRCVPPAATSSQLAQNNTMYSPGHPRLSSTTT